MTAKPLDPTTTPGVPSPSPWTALFTASAAGELSQDGSPQRVPPTQRTRLIRGAPGGAQEPLQPNGFRVPLSPPMPRRV